MSEHESSHVRLDFDDLIRNYLENLNVTLRGFNPAEGFDFLETYVPSDDPTEALLELIELARDAAVDRLTITMSTQTAAKTDFSKISAAAGPFTERRLEEKLELNFALRTDAALDIHPCYRDRLTRVLENVTFGVPISASPGSKLFCATAEGVSLTAAVNLKRGMVTEVGFSGGTQVQRGLLELLCATMKSRPLQESADHALIYVEKELRDPAVPPPVPGLLMPENADPAFRLPLQLVREVLQAFQAETGSHATQNFHDRPVGKAWAAMTDQQRGARLTEAIQADVALEQVELVGMDGPKRVVVRFQEGLDNAAQQQLLVRLESQLKATVEPTLQLLAQTRNDRNIVRITEKKKLD